MAIVGPSSPQLAQAADRDIHFDSADVMSFGGESIRRIVENNDTAREDYHD